MPVVRRSKEEDVELIKTQPLLNGNAVAVNGHGDSNDLNDDTDHVNTTDHVNHTDHTSSHKHASSEKTENHNTKNKLEERHMISTVQTVKIPGGSEVRTVQTVELRKVTINGTTQQPANVQDQNREE